MRPPAVAAASAAGLLAGLPPMRFTRPTVSFAAAAVLALAACRDALAPAGVAPDDAPAPGAVLDGGAIPGHYLVRLRPGSGDVARRARAMVADRRGTLVRTFGGDIQGFAAELPDDAVQALRDDPDVALVEPDRLVSAAGVQLDADWGLDRLDQRALPLTGTYMVTLTVTDGAGATGTITKAVAVP